MHALDTTTITRRRNHEAAVVVVVLAALGGLGFAATLLPTAVVIGIAALPVAAWAVRRVARVLRWRREDRADALTAAAWRSTHPRPVRDLQGVA